MNKIVSINSTEICCANCNTTFREEVPADFQAAQCPHCQWWVNAYGTVVSKHHCKDCDRDFVICPPIPIGTPNWDSCLAEDCTSYDPNRDADKYFRA